MPGVAQHIAKRASLRALRLDIDAYALRAQHLGSSACRGAKTS
jgi:hypothetical protein